MHYLKSLLPVILITLLSWKAGAQTTDSSVKGVLRDQNGHAVPFAYVFIDSLNIGTASDAEGHYALKNIPPGRHKITVRYMGYKTTSQWVNVTGNTSPVINFALEEDAHTLKEVTVEGTSQAQEIKESGYSVNVIETKEVQDREVTLNQLTSRTAGIRVRESGGLGSGFNYSLDGMSGRSIRFFIDGIPMDRYGSAYSINNLPVNLVERVEIYKGVVPPQFGSDALGGIINLVTKSKKKKYLDASYSHGSFNTHRAALSTRWVHDSSNFYVDAQAFYNYADNNYWVWGRGVEVADPVTGRAVEIKTRRFHDMYRSASGKIGIGFFDKKWADQFNINMIYAGNFKELQNGTTMAAVYGEATRAEKSYAPSLFYSKQRLFGTGLNAALYSSISFQESKIIDTSSRTYDWQGKVVDEHPLNSELGRGNNGKSMLTMESVNWFQQLNLSYVFNEKHKIYANYTFDLTKREGKDPYIADRTASFITPQNLRKQISSLAYELTTFKKLVHTAWVKNYDFSVSTVGERYITDSLGYRPVAYSIKRSNNYWGYGYALKYSLRKFNILKFSAEKCYRLPDAEEVLGDGLFVRASPNLEPEESVNLNLGWLLSNIVISKRSKFIVELSTFYRNTYNQILYQLQGTLGTGSYSNVLKVRSYGVSLDAKYLYNERLRIRGNVTYQQPRDWNEYVGVSRNLTYRDLLPNTPYLMSNGEFAYTQKNVFQKKSELSVFWDVQYVHQFFLRWPSLGNQNKAFIPTQLVHSTGISYSMKSGMYNMSVGCQNMFNEQVYDNYLLQKPGRSFYVKLRIFIN